MRVRTAYAIVGAALPSLAIACNSVLGIGAPGASEAPAEAGSPAIDGATSPAPDATLPSVADASSSGEASASSSGDASASSSGDASASSVEAGLDGGSEGPSDAPYEAGPYHDAADPAFWTTYTLALDAATFPGFAGGTFDGRYVYAGTLYSDPSGGVVRYDTQGDASFSAGWETLALPITSDDVWLMPWGVVYDGVSVTLVPGDTTTVPATYPTNAPFDPSSITTVSGDVWWNRNLWVFGGFCGGAVVPAQDGGAASILLAPYESWNVDNSGPSNTVALYDGQAWQYHALPEESDDLPLGNFCGAVFDGQYVYFVPSVGYGALEHARFNTKLHPSITDSFADANAWELVHVTTVGSGAAGFFGGAFDGRYVYYVPFVGTVVARFDTRSDAGFADTSAWDSFDLTPLATPSPTGFQGGAFDGRFVYLVPTTTTPNGDWTSNPRAVADAGVPPLVRYDTFDPQFTDAQAWQTFDLQGVDPGVAGFTGAIFDGKFLYLVPAQGSTFLRFDARDPDGNGPPGYSHGSFF